MPKQIDETKFNKLVAALERKPCTVKELASRLRIGERTVYTWLGLAGAEHEIVRVGWNPTKWHILSA